jgi:hypothetical protein
LQRGWLLFDMWLTVAGRHVPSAVNPSHVPAHGPSTRRRTPRVGIVWGRVSGILKEVVRLGLGVRGGKEPTQLLLGRSKLLLASHQLSTQAVCRMLVPCLQSTRQVIWGGQRLGCGYHLCRKQVPSGQSG